MSGIRRGSIPVVLEGEPSATDLGRLRRDDLTGPLNERIVPAVWWSGIEGFVTVTPVRWLEDEATYSLVSPNAGVLAAIEVRPGAPRLERLWPPAGVAVSDGRAVLCGARAEASDRAVELGPGVVAGVVRSGIGASGMAMDRCITVVAESLEEAGDFLLLPRDLSGVAVDPSPIELAEPLDVEPLACTDDELDVGAGCVTAFDNRLLVRTNGLPALWALVLDGREFLEVAQGAELTVPDLQPGVAVSMRGLVLDAAGEEFSIDGEITLAEPAGAPVIGEVYADALGPEPGQEWVELVNVGAGAVDLRGWMLEDATAASALPAATLAPGAYGVVLTPDYDVTLDPEPARDAVLLFVDKIGGQGLTNSGEALRLVDPTGKVRSRFPARAARPGVSAARRFPWSSDSDATAFGRHAPPGASPGSPNVLEAE
jgi:hypothetical protein